MKIWNSAVASTCRWLCKTFPDRARTVPRSDFPEIAMLTQFKVISKILYLQHFENPESIDYLHRHRWHYMRSWILSGEYTEERPGGVKITHTAGTTFSMDHNTIHRVDAWGEDCWTLFLMLKPDEDWGWYERDGLGLGKFTHWREFLKARVPSLDTGKIT